MQTAFGSHFSYQVPSLTETRYAMADWYTWEACPFQKRREGEGRGGIGRRGEGKVGKGRGGVGRRGEGKVGKGRKEKEESK